MTIAKKLAELREGRKESLQDVATAVNSSKAHIWELETGKSKKPSIDLIRRLADHFKVSIAWLVGEAAHGGAEQERTTALIRAVNELSEPNKDVLQTIIDSMRRGQQSQ